MIEKHYDYTGYAYVYNNPMNYIDPFGLDTINVVQETEDGTKVASWNTEKETLQEFLKREFGITDSESSDNSDDSESEEDESDQNYGNPLVAKGISGDGAREKAKHTGPSIDIGPFLISPFGYGNTIELFKMIQGWFSSDESSGTSGKTNKNKSNNNTDANGKPLKEYSKVEIWNLKNGRTTFSKDFKRDTIMRTKEIDSLYKAGASPYPDVLRIERN